MGLRPSSGGRQRSAHGHRSAPGRGWQDQDRPALRGWTAGPRLGGVDTEQVAVRQHGWREPTPGWSWPRAGSPAACRRPQVHTWVGPAPPWSAGTSAPRGRCPRARAVKGPAWRLGCLVEERDHHPRGRQESSSTIQPRPGRKRPTPAGRRPPARPPAPSRQETPPRGRKGRLPTALERRTAPSPTTFARSHRENHRVLH